MQHTVGKSDRTLIAIVAIVGVIVAIALVVIFTRGDPATIDSSKPEGVVQEYTLAVISGDRAKALSLVSSPLRESCDRAEPNMTEDIRMTVVSTKSRADSSIVRVLISHGNGSSPFGGSGYESHESFSLLKDGDSWKIESSPWELMVCFNQMGNS